MQRRCRATTDHQHHHAAQAPADARIYRPRRNLAHKRGLWVCYGVSNLAPIGRSASRNSQQNKPTRTKSSGTQAWTVGPATECQIWPRSVEELLDEIHNCNAAEAYVSDPTTSISIIVVSRTERCRSSSSHVSVTDDSEMSDSRDHTGRKTDISLSLSVAVSEDQMFRLALEARNSVSTRL